MGGWSEIDWVALFALSVPPAELVIRGTAMYLFLFLLFRFVLRRDVGSVGIADILVLVIIADASQNAMSGDYKSIGDGMVLVATLAFWNLLFDWASFNFPAVRAVLEPKPLCLAKDGKLLRRNMRKEFITEDELRNKLREHEIESFDLVDKIFMEPDGSISVIKRKPAD
jgi:uncharacterized membrane protein YcaP (DUF421 family)